MLPRLALLTLLSLFANAQPLAITNVTVIDVTTGAHRTTDVLIEAGRITSIAPEIKLPRGATRVNGKGKFLIPGLWDMHAHHQGTGAEQTDLFVAKGVTGTRDMGADAAFIFPLRRRIQAGELLGPEIVAAGPMLDDAPPAFPYRLHVTNAAEARAAVRELKQLGSDFIKVHDHTPREVFFAIADEAPRAGLTFSGHVPINVTIDEAAASGMRSIEHLANYRVISDCSPGEKYSPTGCAAILDKLAANRVWQTPTLEFFQTMPDVFSGVPLHHAEYASNSLLELTRHNIEVSNVPKTTLDALRIAARETLPALLDMRRHGIQFLAGCDGLVPGFCLHDELEWFTKAGFTPLEALQTATINPARFLGREASQGTVDVGKQADMVLLDADPTTDIRHIARIAAVVLRGKVVQKSEISKIVAKHRQKL